jgi:hypothetical protein
MDSDERIGVRDHQPITKTATDARQGQKTGVVRWVLGISVTAAIIGMIVAFWVS